ncbi:MAG: hypothetical protein GF370_01075 [Candidatus Nealsonbacteria bacterium]|nr:hypothetical protein [Candidatus Nealsonbacteria bacterium]
MKFLSRVRRAVWPIFLLTLFWLFLAATTEASVVINEIAWMGTLESYRQEWIELYNTSSSSISLSEWKVKAQGSGIEIPLLGTIPPGEFYLLKRSGEDPAPNTPSDQVYKGALKNSGEHLLLIDGSGNIKDEINCSNGWFAGDNDTKQTMERKDALSSGSSPQNWHNSYDPLGTPKRGNSQQEIRPSFQMTLPRIRFNEILPAPEGPDKEEEWIEIKNEGSTPASLAGLSISDKIGATHIYNFPINSNIPSYGFLLLPRQETKITLNNQGDGLVLLGPEETIIDSVSYEEAPTGESYSLIGGSWQWRSPPTPEKENQAPAEEHVTNLSPETLKAEVRPAYQSLNIEKQKGRFSFNFFLLSAFSVLISLFSALVIIILKNNTKN